MQVSHQPRRHQALEVPEIAHLVLGECDLRSTTVSNILVCQVWLQVGLSIIWREVRDARRLVALLGQIDPCSINVRDNLDQWNHFQAIYAWRIRRLILSDTIAFWSCLHNLASNVVWNGPLFPQLEALDLRNTLNHLSTRLHLLVNSNVTKFVLQSPSVLNQEYLVDFVKNMPVLMPNLRHVELRITPPVSPQLSAACAEMCNALGNSLETLLLPPPPDCTSHVNAVAFHQNLRVLCLAIEFYDIPEPTDDMELHYTRVLPVLPSHPSIFPSLRQLNLVCPVPLAIQLIEQPGFPRNLTSLSIKSPSDTQSELPSTVRHLSYALEAKCPNLQYFSLDYFIEDTYYDNIPNGMITYDDLAPLRSCTKMRHFSIFAHLYPLSINDEELALLVSAWPHLTALHLNPDPLMVYDEDVWPRERKQLTWRSFLGLARYVPRLEVVLVLIDPVPRGVPSLEEVESHGRDFGEFGPKLLKLGYLNAGMLCDPLSARIEENPELKGFLYKMAPKKCVFDHRDMYTRYVI
ncbi:hypothetical protein AAF712_008096 [Marasmius tenuissimus]|uniref:F-box domain-containing protein n=1 Tax=Marasmius tenuissimus TaxID=585030 RepID=A0ABR2ZV89_9AGAR